MPRTIHASATAIAAYKACPERFNLGYVEGLRLLEDTDTQRVGTNWHALHEVYRKTINGLRCICPPECHDELCPYCTPNLTPDDVRNQAFDAAIAHLNEKYAVTPDGKTMEEWAVERITLAVCFACHVWYYQNEPLDVVATEIEFALPIHHPKTGLPLPTDQVIRVGKIDTLVRREGLVGPWDYKSTSKDIGQDSGFWNHLRLDTQINLYLMSAQEMHAAGHLAQYGIGAEERVAGAGYDVWRKPAIKPKMLTQAESKEFGTEKLVTYCGQQFHVERDPHLTVNGWKAEIEPGKKDGTFAIRETPEMFGARLRQDIMSRPDHYFQRRIIPRTEADIRKFRAQLYSIYQSMKFSRDTGHWFQNEHQCRATFPCPYIPICHHGLDVSGDKTPAGFRRIFTPITVGGEEL